MMLFDDNEEITINILNNEISLDQKCWCCDGGEKEPMKEFQSESGICQHCNDSGLILTDVGSAIIKLVRRHYSKLFSEEF